MPIVNLVAPEQGGIPLEVKVTEATELQALLVNSKLRLYKDGAGINPGAVDLATLVANECDFDGYPAGGIALAAWGDPMIGDGIDAVLLAAPSKQFNWAHVAGDIANDVKGAFVVDATGNLRGVWEMETAVTMSNALSALSMQVTRRL